MKVLLFANTDWYLYNFRRALALRLRDTGYEVLLVSPNGAYVDKLKALGFRWIAAPMQRRSLNPVTELRLIVWLTNLIRQEQVDLVHGFTIKNAVYGSLAARFAGNRPRVGAVAGLGYVFTSDTVKARLLRPFVRMIMKAALDGSRGRLILQNPDDVALFERQRIVHPDQIRLIRGSGVDCLRFHTGGKRKPGDPLCVLLAARLLWDKGIGEYVEAARILRTQGRSIHFLLAGSPDEGNPNAVPVDTLKSWVSDGLIEWLGHVEDMPHLLQSVHVMTLPTAYGEGVPRSLLEAGACGVTLITTDTPGCREVVTHEKDGLLIPVKDAVALAASIARLDDDPHFTANLGAAVQEKVRSEFDERIVILETMKVYDELLGDMSKCPKH